jgi:opacity protein-like surface antigen
MKKMAIVLVGGMLLVSTVCANARTKMSLGIKGGLAMATMYGADIDNLTSGMDKGMRMGMDIGAAFAIGFTDLIGLSAEARSTQKGVKIKAKTDGSNNYIAFKMDYIDVPVLLSVTPFHGPVAPYFLAGPQLSIKTSADVGGKLGGTTVPDIDWGSVLLPKPAAMDFGFAAGAGVAITVGPGKALIEYRFGMGFITVDGSSSGTKAVMKNMVPAAIMAGYMVAL